MQALVTTLEKLVPARKINIFKEEALLMSSLPYYSLLLVMLLGYSAIWNHPWFLAALVYAILPLMDELFLKDYTNPTEEERKELQRRNPYFKACLILTLVLDWFIFTEVMTYLSTYSIEEKGIYNLLGLIFVYSNLNATQFTVAHQIYHKGGLLNRLTGTLHMSRCLYTHFSYEHLYGHHKRVATPEDPCTAPQHMNVYRFFLKSFSGTFQNVYRMEQEEGKHWFTNYAVLSVAWAIGFTVMVWAIWGGQTTVFFLIQAGISVFLVESINYIEHYGLLRKRLENGQYEKVTIKHSWNAPHRFTNYLLFKLQRHSDHHENSSKPYQTLLSLNESPQLPHGYSLMVSMALFPQVWFKVMDPLVDEYRRVGNGSIKTGITEIAIFESRLFQRRIGLAAMGLWALEWML